MASFSTLLAWLDIRADEGRNLVLSVLGAFLVIAFVVLARSLREALYLTTYDIKALPYITAAVALLSLPVVGGFMRLLTQVHPWRILRWLAGVTVAGLCVLWPLATHHAVTVVIFFIWTALATMLLTSGFWIVTAEHFGGA